MSTRETFLNEFNDQMKDLYIRSSEAGWMAQTTGEAEWAEKSGEEDTKYSLLFSSKEKYEEALKFFETDSGSVEERRQLQLLVNDMKSNQLPEEIIADLAKRGSELNYLFNTYSPEVDGKVYSANDIREVLLTSTDLELRKKVWLASKEVGGVVEKGLL